VRAMSAPAARAEAVREAPATTARRWIGEGMGFLS